MKETKYDIKEIGTVVFTEEEALLKTEKMFFIHLFDKDYKIPIIFNLREEKLFQDKQCKFPICIFKLLNRLEKELEDILIIIEKETLKHYNEEIAECEKMRKEKHFPI